MKKFKEMAFLKTHRMENKMDDDKLTNLLINAVEIGFKKGLMTGAITEVKLKPYLSKTQAYELYGRRNVDFWIKNKLVKEIKDGDNNAMIRLDRMKLEIVAATSNRGL